ncbi:hypothetical protein FDP41_003931 [Naegleria fowleri]|uniref:Serpin domain-containing protein n=1 Tax=Naegleria fowleri TaxID=5763 RepID=A0A6A5BTJ2_NAEFO|nr:uncharacterized protein FDP41_003931 [Naegleria fowleri]KAF0977278.1 hypothetical protein FDP41_003931 [Naegleria fowleri]CAG4717844.1 unnamed protein product [Naegleria fowleri]
MFSTSKSTLVGAFILITMMMIAITTTHVKCQDDDVKLVNTDPLTSSSSSPLGNIPVLNTPSDQQAIDISKSATQFAGQLMNQLITNSINDHFRNMMFSPLSLSQSLSILLQAATEEPNELGAQKKQELNTLLNKIGIGNLNKVLQAIETSSKDVGGASGSTSSEMFPKLVLTHALFASEPFIEKTPFKSLSLYVKSVNFSNVEQSREFINNFISEKNGETTSPLIGTGFLKNTTQAIFADTAFYFGKWEKPFDLNQTSIEFFRTISPNDEDVIENVEVDMMNKMDVVEEYGEFRNFHWISMKYHSQDFAMIFAVTKDQVSLHGDSEERFNRFITRKLNSGCLSCSFPTTPQSLKRVSIPKFRIESKVKLSSILKEKPFSLPSLFPKKVKVPKKPKTTTNSTTEPVATTPTTVEETPQDAKPSESGWVLDELFHKCIMEISELGTVEGELTPETATTNETKENDGDKTFVLDRPFAMILHHLPTNSPVFVAKVAVL